MRTAHYTEKELLHLLDRKQGDDPHLAACPSCLARFHFLEHLQGALREQLAAPVDPRIHSLAQRVAEKNIIVLKPHVSGPDLSRIGTRDDLILLAAQGETTEPARHVVLGTFAATAEKMLVRVVADREKHRVLLHLLTEHPEDADCVRVVIAPHNGDQLIVETDKSGVAVVPGEHDISWSDAVIAVQGRRA
jgi:hypothetical protein